MHTPKTFNQQFQPKKSNNLPIFPTSPQPERKEISAMAKQKKPYYELGLREFLFCQFSTFTSR